ncbi:MAG: DUF2147 domain-containing protein [Tunicatimonas sp.]|uniref:DUF2147 domain-containing protein n=1 Tax=Tunicatimonas sp. TaxID=1940096 RepID=UPI003C708045
MIKSILIAAFLAINIHNTALAQTADAVVGEWNTSENRAKIEVYNCGESYCGKIVWLKEPNNPDGSTKLDKENPDEAFRTRPIVGTEILKELEYDGDGEYEDGEIYDPESGKTYSCLMRLKEDGNVLEVRGYIGISLMGRSERWSRAR